MEELIVKYLTKCITEDELQILSGWLDHPENKKLFNDYVRINYAIDYAMDDYGTGKARQKLLDYIIADKIKKSGPKFSIRTLGKTYRYAASIFLLLLIAGYLYVSRTSVVPDDPKLVTRDVVTLTLDDGTLIPLSAEDTGKVINNTRGNEVAIQQQNLLNYHHSNSGEPEYNTLVVPDGKRFQLKLSDGSKVWLNSASSVKYPVMFSDRGNREIYLEGEAFFKVTKNEKQPFIVLTKQLSTKVLGTSFNVKAYNDELQITVSVATGKVQVSSIHERAGKDQSCILMPNQQTVYNPPENTFSTRECNVSDFTAWKDGVLVFNQTPLSEVAKSLERWYGVTVIIESPGLKKRIIRGRHEKETITEVLTTLQFIIDFDFDIKDKTVTIKEKSTNQSNS